MSKSSDEIVFCLSDIWMLFARYKKNIFISAILISILVLFILLVFPVKYEVKASFRELQDREENTSLKDLFVSTISSKAICQASSVMLSNSVLEPLVRDLGLQANVEVKCGILSRFYNNFSENISAEFNKSLQDIDRFKFKDIQYEGEKFLTIFIRFDSETVFEMLNDKKESVGMGQVNSSCSYVDIASFTIVKTPNNLKLNKIYTLTLSPMVVAVSFLSENIKIEIHKENINLLYLSLYMRDRRLGVTILNSLMDHYQNYLKSENKFFSRLQLTYLEERQDELQNKLKKDLDEYVQYLSENLEEKGYMTLDQELDMLFSPHSKYLSNIFSVDLELMRLKNLNLQKNNSYIEDESLSGRELKQISSQLAELRQEKDSVNLSLYPRMEDYSKNSYQETIKDLDEKVESIELELAKLQKGEINWENDLSGGYGEGLQKLCIEKKQYLKERDNLPLPFDVEDDLSMLEKKGKELDLIQKKKNHGEELLKYLADDSFEKRNLSVYLKNVVGEKYGKIDGLFFDKDKRNFICDYIKNHLHLLSLRENILKEGYEPSDESCFNCMDINSVKKIFIEYNEMLDEIILEIEELDHGKKELSLESFEITSLGLILKDSISLEVLNKVGKLSIELKDTKNRGEKSIVRLQDDLALQKNFLFHHIEELIQLKEINKKLVMGKIKSLKKVILNGINQKIFLLNDRAESFVKSRIENLNVEKQLLQEKTMELQRKMETVPQRWKLEKLLQLKSEMSMKMIQAITQLQESKNIAHHLSQIQSKPLDLAALPLSPISPNLRFIFLLSVIIATIFAYSFYFFKSALKGFYVSLASLEASNQSICGKITLLCDGESAEYNQKDLDTLREISSQVLENKKTKVVSLIGNGGPNYSSSLAALFGKSEKRVLLVDCDFYLYSSDDNDKEGFLKYLKKNMKDLPIVKRKEYEYMRAGGYTRHSTEVMGSTGFTNLIDGLSQNYDFVFLYTSASLKSSDAKVLLNFSDMAVVTIIDETMKDIKFYVKWKDDNYCRYLSFIAIS